MSMMYRSIYLDFFLLAFYSFQYTNPVGFILYTYIFNVLNACKCYVLNFSFQMFIVSMLKYNFYMLILYHENLLNSFISFSFFYLIVDFLGSFCRQSCHLKIGMFLFLLICLLSISFSFLVALVRTSSTILNRVVRAEIFALCSVVRGKHSAFHQ